MNEITVVVPPANTTLNAEIVISVPDTNVVISQAKSLAADVHLVLTGTKGDKGDSGSSQVFVYNQVAPAALWTIPHNFARLPGVAVYETSGQIIEPDIYADSQQVVLTFSSPASGKAVIS